MPKPICKIHPIFNDKVIFASIGIHGMGKSLNVFECAKLASFPAKNLYDIIINFSNIIDKKLTRISKQLQKSDRLLFDSLYANKSGGRIEAVFIGTINDSLRLYYSWFQVRTTNTDSCFVEKTPIWFCPKDCKSGWDWNAFGYRDTILAFTSNKPNFIREDTPQHLYQLIELQCMSDSINVGKPIFLLRIDKNGYRWIPSEEPKCRN